ncbi:hypothetical protein O181_101231 [Austropuccinia psidii MF-1]|uniref:Uncharacterized protein n=1 Tax=Austropuccinia psidii MF-1 TaxID=1389203 RepID=A0A9Q3PIG5_9BASI|nr:hypothetical protein [Austropuccinia psidii MF-1]
MVHTRNGSSYSVQPDGPRQGRGKTRTRSAKSSSRKTHLKDARASPHSPRSVPTNFDVSSESELIEGNISRAEPLPSGSHRHISVPIQKLVKSSKRRGVGNMPKPFAGGHELLHIHQELSWSGEDHRNLRRVAPISLQRQCQEDTELVEEQKSFTCRPEEGIGSYSIFGRSPSGVYQLQTRSRNIQREAQRTSEDEEMSQELSGKGKRQSKFAKTLATRVQDPQIGAFSCGQCLQYGQTSSGIHSQIAGNDEQDLSTQVIQEIKNFRSSIDLELGKFDAKLNKITSDISELKRNDKTILNGLSLQMSNLIQLPIHVKALKVNVNLKMMKREIFPVETLMINLEL